MRARDILVGLLGAVALGLAGFLALAWYPAIPELEPPSRSSFEPQSIARGAELARIGNCNVCHTQPGGEPYAGGRPVATPFGTIYATNITPDPDTGIGRWSERAFLRSMHEGVGRDGRHLYPAFPYDHFTKVSDQDVGAIYAFLMTREPVRAQVPINDLAFPFNFRPLIAGWKLLFFETGRFEPTAGQAPNIARGAYLVHGLAHCGACHTPRNALGAEKPDHYLGGGESEGWHAPALNAASPSPLPWTAEQLATYLRQGFVANHGVAAGPMQPVTDNLGKAPEQDVEAIVAYVGSILAPATADRRQTTEQLAAQTESSDVSLWRAAPPTTTGSTAAPPGGNGATLYAGACAMCHEATGLRFSAHGIHLASSKVVAMSDPRNLVHVILEGIEAPAGAPAASMPGFATAFTDQQVTALATYLRATFSDQPPWIDLENQIRKVRRQNASN
jgi:mono/diheme cytochrome c family protein